MRVKSGYIVGIALLFLLPAMVFAGGRQDSAGASGSLSAGQEERGPVALDGLSSADVRALAMMEKNIGGSGDSVVTLTEEKAVEYALENNLQIRSAAIEMGMKKRAEEYAWNRFVPTVQASGTLGRMNAEQSTIDFITFNEIGLPQWSVSGALDFSLTLNLALYNGVKATQIDYQAGRISYEQARKRIVRDVRKSFFNLLLMQENRALMVENIDAAERRYEQALINYENGMVPELTVLSAQVAWENLKPQLKAMDLGYRQAVQGFKMTLGMELDREIELEGSIDAEAVDVDADELIDRYLADRLDIQSMLVSINSLENQLKATKLQVYTPQLILGYSLDPTFGGDPWSDPWFGGDFEWNQRSGMFRATIALSLDGFLPFSQTQVGIRDLKDSIELSRIGLMQTIRGAEMEVDATVEQLKKSRDTLEALELNVDLARRAYEMAEEAYNAGSRELLEVENAEIELKTAQVEVLKEKYNYLSALIDLEYQLNNDMDTMITE
ncbi:MAG: TolC family protein [Spirochaetota bacterium]|nr:TolC family protein [Spirochaetota bacterium]